MILADTSAWIEYDRATGSAVHRRLRQVIHDDEPLATTQPVVMEVVSGARSDQAERELRRMLLAPTLLGFDADVDFDGATRVYRACRSAGVTPRGLVDCMIVAVALRFGASVLAHDGDFRLMARVVPLELDEATI